MKPSTFFLTCVIVATSAPGYSQEEAPFPPPPANVSSIATMTSEDEPGERLVISGIVYEVNGMTPLRGFVLYLYQTDASGVYNKTDRNWQRPRIRGWVRTDNDGKYEIRTIKPGSYPRSRNPAHIHVIVKLPGNEPEWIDDFLFEGDQFLSDEDRKRMDRDERFSPVMRVARDEKGILHCARNIRIPPANIKH